MDKKISQLTAATTPLTGAEELAIVQSGSTVKATAQDVADLAPAPSPSYLVYTALLSQSGTNAPVATVLENTLGGTVVWTYSSAGSYRATLAGAFPANKVFFIVEQEASYNGGPQIYAQNIRNFTRVTDDIVDLSNTELRFTAGAFTSAGNVNDFFNLSIEIRVYN